MIRFSIPSPRPAPSAAHREENPRMPKFEINYTTTADTAPTGLPAGAKVKRVSSLPLELKAPRLDGHAVDAAHQAGRERRGRVARLGPADLRRNRHRVRHGAPHRGAVPRAGRRADRGRRRQGRQGQGRPPVGLVHGRPHGVAHSRDAPRHRAGRRAPLRVPPRRLRLLTS